jgi:preprotein translocase subunit SecE
MPAGDNSLRRTTAVIAAVITAIALLIALLDAGTASAIRALFNA